MGQIKQHFLQVVGLVSSLKLLLPVFFIDSLASVDSGIVVTYTVFVDTVYCGQLHCVLWTVTLCILDNYTVDRYVEGISLKLGVIILMLPLSLKGNVRSVYNLHLLNNPCMTNIRVRQIQGMGWDEWPQS